MVQTPHGPFRMIAYLEKTRETHLALVRGNRTRRRDAVRVHEPLSLLDLLDMAPGTHSWTVMDSLARIDEAGKGVMVLLNCSESTAQLIERVTTLTRPKAAAKFDLLTYGIGAQILLNLNVGKMRLLARPRKMPSMAGWGLEVVVYVEPQSAERERSAGK